MKCKCHIFSLQIYYPYWSVLKKTLYNNSHIAYKNTYLMQQVSVYYMQNIQL